MTSSQRHQDGSDNPQLLAGDGLGPGPLAPTYAVRGVRFSALKIRAKQSQFVPEGRIGGASPTLQVRSNAPNKPNLAKPAGRPDRPGAKTCETNPIPGGAGWDGASGTRGKCAKRTQFGAARLASGGRLCKTKPVSRLRISDWGQTYGGTPAPPGIYCAKRTQFVARRTGARRKSGEDAQPTKSRLVQDEANFGELAGGWNTHHSNPMPIVQNEPNLAAPTPAMTGRLTVSSPLRWSRLYWVATSNRRTIMERGRL